MWSDYIFLNILQATAVFFVCYVGLLGIVEKFVLSYYFFYDSIDFKGSLFSEALINSNLPIF